MKKQILSLFVVVTMVFSMMPPMIFNVNAGEDGAKSINLGTAGIAKSDYIYYGYNGSGVKWKTLSLNGNATGFHDELSNNNHDTIGNRDALFLMSEDAQTGQSVSFSSSGSTDYQGSEAQQWCTNFYESLVLSNSERSAIASVDTSIRENKNGLNGDKIFFLSKAEATNSDYGLGSSSSKIATYQDEIADWWLRSTGSSLLDSVSKVNHWGEIGDSYSNVSLAARPADIRLRLPQALMS